MNTGGNFMISALVIRCPKFCCCSFEMKRSNLTELKALPCLALPRRAREIAGRFENASRDFSFVVVLARLGGEPWCRAFFVQRHAFDAHIRVADQINLRLALVAAHTSMIRFRSDNL